MSAPQLRVIEGEGLGRPEPLQSRDAVVRVLLEAGVGVLLRQITPERAQEIERRVDRLMLLFDRLDAKPELSAALEQELGELEALMRQTRSKRRRRP